jgi:hypothetical protein
VAQGGLHQSHARKRVYLQSVLPDPNNSPAALAKEHGRVFVSRCVAAQFFSPKGGVRLWNLSVPRAAMPETSIQKNGDTMVKENEIRVRSIETLPLRSRMLCSCGQSYLLVSAPASNSCRMKCLRERGFGGLIAAPANRSHHMRSLRFGENVSHRGGLLFEWAAQGGEPLASFFSPLRPAANLCTHVHSRLAAFPESV